MRRLVVIKTYLKNEFLIDIIMLGTIILEFYQISNLWGLFALFYLLSLAKLNNLINSITNTIILSSF